METLRIRWLVLAVLAVSLSATGLARAEDTRHKINAQGEGAFTGPTTTASQILDGGILQGTTTADLTITGIDPQTGVLTYVGILVLTAEHGTLTLDIFNGVYRHGDRRIQQRQQCHRRDRQLRGRDRQPLFPRLRVPRRHFRG